MSMHHSLGKKGALHGELAIMEQPLLEIFESEADHFFQSVKQFQYGRSFLRGPVEAWIETMWSSDLSFLYSNWSLEDHSG